MSYDPIASLNLGGGLDTSSPLLSPQSMAGLNDGSWNAIISGSGHTRPWGGATAAAEGSGSAKMMPFSDTWGGIKGYHYLDKTFVMSTVDNTAHTVTTATAHGYVTGLRCNVTSTIDYPVLLPNLTDPLLSYYVIVVDSTTLKFADTLANALAGTAIAITKVGKDPASVITIDLSSNDPVTASGNWMEDIGRSRWGIGSGQPMITGVPVPGYLLSTNLQVQIPDDTGAFGPPVQAGLSQPSAPGIGIINTVGVVSNPISAKVARSRPSTGAISVASPNSAVVNPQLNRLRITYPAASPGQTHWRTYLTLQGFGGNGISYLAPYGIYTDGDIPESVVAAGSAAGAYATGQISIWAPRPNAGDTIEVNGITFTFVAAAPGADEVLIGAGPGGEATAANLAAVLNASTHPEVQEASYVIGGGGGYIYITYDTVGVAGNAFTLDAPINTANAIQYVAMSGGADGVGRSLEFNLGDGDLIPIEASFDDYAPPAATHAMRLNTVMNLAGCYAAGVLSASNAGTAIAVSKENNYESYVPTSLLYLPEQVTDVLARPIDDYGYVGCPNSVHALQYVGNRGDELPSCTLTTILPDIGIQYQNNWCHARGQLLLYVAPGILFLMDESGSFDSTFASPVVATLMTFDLENTSVGYDGGTDSFVVMNGKRMLVFSLQTRTWRQIWLPDYAPRHAAGDYTFTVNPADATNISFNGSLFRFKDVPVFATDIQIADGDLAATLANAVAVLNASVDVAVSVATYSVVGSNKIMVVYDTAGVGGNAYALGTNTASIVRSATTLTGGLAGIEGTALSCTNSRGTLYMSLTDGGVETAYAYNSLSNTAPISFVSNPQNAGGVVVDDLYEVALAAQSSISTPVAIVINRNMTKTAFRLISSTGGDTTLTDAESTFTANMEGKHFILFGPNVGGANIDYIRGRVVTYTSSSSIEVDVDIAVSDTDLLMFVGDYAAVGSISAAEHLPNFFPNVPELRSFSFGVWLKSQGEVGNVLSADFLGTQYASSRAR